VASPSAIFHDLGKIRLLIIKTKEEKFSGLKDWILENHSYDIPEVIALPITQGSSDYLKCIDDWVG
jgi:periplasmic divalent cation tolerance protein